MDNKTRATLVAGLVVAFAVGFAAASSPYSPIKPRPDRPVLRFLASVARTGLWFMMFAEPAPAGEPAHLVHHTIGDDGYQRLQHGESF